MKQIRATAPDQASHFYHGRLLRLPDLPDLTAAAPVEVSTMVNTLMQAKERWAGDLLPELNLDHAIKNQLPQFLAAGQWLRERWPGVGSYQSWSEIRGQDRVPPIDAATTFLYNQVNLPLDALSWLNACVGTFNRLTNALSAVYATAGQTASTKQTIYH
jgi:hypothetical protein